MRSVKEMAGLRKGLPPEASSLYFGLLTAIKRDPVRALGIQAKGQSPNTTAVRAGSAGRLWAPDHSVATAGGREPPCFPPIQQSTIDNSRSKTQLLGMLWLPLGSF